MRYTINGSPPTSTTGTLIASQSGTVSLTPSSQGTTLRIIAFKAGMNDSPVHSATYYYENGNAPEEAGEGSNGQPAYDGNGNLIRHKGWTYTYDAQNRLIWASDGMTTAEFYYDGKNRQIARRIGPQSGGGGVVRFSSWDVWELLEEYGSGLSITKGYLQGATGVIKSWDPIYGQMYYYQDKLGSTTHVASATGALLENYRYNLYGTPTYYDSLNNQRSTTNYSVHDLYAGERWIPELGLYDLRNRFMSSKLGRFLQPDPIGFKGDPSNLYRYCGNDSVNRTDPDGLVDTSSSSNIWRNLMNFFNGNPSINIVLADWMQRVQAAGMGMTSGGDVGGSQSKSISEASEGKKGGVKVTGGNSQEHKYIQGKTDRVLATPRGQQLLSRLRKENKIVTIHIFHRRGDGSGAYTLDNFRDIYIDPSYHPEVLTTKGWIRSSTERNIAHELGHAVTRDSPSYHIEHVLRNMDNINNNENPIMRALGQPDRISPD